MPQIPSLNPITAPGAYCTTCGNLMQTEIDTFGKNRKIQGIWYICKNKDSGCNYRVYHDSRLQGQATVLPSKPEEKKD